MNDWIDIEKQKPEHNQKIMIKGKFPFEIDCIFELTDKGFDFVSYSSKAVKCWCFYGVTHWKPLPAPPEVK